MPVRVDIRPVHKKDLEDWEPTLPEKNTRHHGSGLRWAISEMETKYRDIVHELDEHLRQKLGKFTTPAEALADADRLQQEVATVAARNACVADAGMEALLDSGATDNTVGRKALTKEQLRRRYKIPKQTYNMAAGQVVVDEAVDLHVPALRVVLQFRMLPGGAGP